MDLETLIGSRANTSFPIGGLYVPANSLTRYLHRFVVPALFFTEMEFPFEFTKSGSATKIKYQGRYFCLLTEHQISAQGYAEDQFFLRNDNTRTLIGADQYFIDTEPDTDKRFLDLVIFEFTNSVIAGDLPSHDWYRLDDEIRFDPYPVPERFICLGYPSEVNSIDYDRPGYEAKAVAIQGKPIRSEIKRRAAFTPDNEILYDPTGMSGGGVFAMLIVRRTPTIYFGGILTNASRTRFNFLLCTRIRKLLASI